MQANQIEFEVKGNPATKARHRTFLNKATGKMQFVSQKEAVEAEGNVRDEAIRHAPADLVRGPVWLEVVFYFLIPPSWPKWKLEALDAGWLQHKSRPDVDNLVKLIKDACNGVIWADDAQVTRLVARKKYTSTLPRTKIKITAFANIASKGQLEFQKEALQNERHQTPATEIVHQRKISSGWNWFFNPIFNLTRR